MLAVLLTACLMPAVPLETTTRPDTAEDPWATLGEPGPWVHEAVESGRWEGKASGLVNFEHPATIGLRDGPVPIVLPIHVLTHPRHGTVIVDTGVPRELPLIGPIAKAALASLETVEPLGDVLDRSSPLAGVVLTHTHPDHILGLVDVPVGTPIYIGPGEWEARALVHSLIGGALEATFQGHAFSELDFPGPRGGFDGVVDLFGDGTLFVLSTPGHTRGALSVVARTEQGGMLFVGDSCHTLWGWEHGVEPGTYTWDHALNARQLASLKALADTHDLAVWVGHELDGEGTGIDPVP